MSLPQRRIQFNEHFRLEVSMKRFRRLYREHKITKQRMTTRLGPKKLPSVEMQ